MGIDQFYRDIYKQAAQFTEHKQKILSIPESVASAAGGRPVVMTGISTSLSALKEPLLLLNQQGIRNAELVNTGDLLDYGYPQEKDDRPLIILSRSGESAETLRLLSVIQPDRKVIGITEGMNSALAGRADVLLDFQAAEEAFPNTSSFTLSQLYGLAVAFGLGYQGKIPLEVLVDKAVEAAEQVKQETNMAEVIGAMLAEAEGVLLEGQGGLTGIVEQYSLDFHETRTLAVPVLGGAMRHGVIELTERSGVAVLLLIPDDCCAKKKWGLARELFREGKKVAVLTNQEGCLERENGEKIPVLQLPPCPKELLGLNFTLGMQQVYGSYARHKGLRSLQPALVGKVTRRE